MLYHLPMVEESEHLEVENVTDYAAMLQEELGEGIAVDFLHGKMKQAQKTEIMERLAVERSRYLSPPRSSKWGSMCPTPPS